MCHRWIWIICFVVTCGCTTGKSVLETEMPNMVVRDSMGTVFTRVSALDNSDSYWSHTIAIKVPKLLETDKHGPFCKQKVRPEQAEIMAYICLMYGHTFKAYEETRAMLINEINRKTKLLEGLIPTGRIQGARNLTLSRQRRVGRAPLEFIGTISRNLFGLATNKDVEILKQHIMSLETQPEHFSGFRKFSQQLSSFRVEINENLKITHDGVHQNQMAINTTLQAINQLQKVFQQDQAAEQVTSVINAISLREINALLILLSEVDNVVESYNTLLRGRLPIHLISPAKIKFILDEVTEHLSMNHPSFKIQYTQPSAYYQMGQVAYTRSEKYLYVKMRIPLSSSELLFHVYAVQNIPVAVMQNNHSFTKIKGLPAYLGVSSDRKFFTELDQVTYQSCTGVNLKQCPSFLRIIEASYPTCSSALFLGNIQYIYDHCKVKLSINSNDRKSHVIDLGDNRVLVSTLDLKWVESCDSMPPRIFKGCTNCVVTRKCSCSLKAGTFFIPPSILACSNTDFKDYEPIGNYLATWSYFMSVESMSLNTTLVKDKDFIQKYQLPRINLTGYQGEKPLELLSLGTELNLKNTLSSLKENNSLYVSPLDAYMDLNGYTSLQGNLEQLKYGVTSGYITPAVVLLEFVLLIIVYRRQRALRLNMQGCLAEILAISAPVQGLPIDDFHSTLTGTEPNYLISVLLILILVSLTCSLLFKVTQLCKNKRKVQKLPTYLELTLTDLDISQTIHFKEFPLMLEDIDISVPDKLPMPTIKYKAYVLPVFR